MYAKLVGIVQLSETLPFAKCSALDRPRDRRATEAETRRKSRSLAPDRPMGWHLFEREKKT